MNVESPLATTLVAWLRHAPRVAERILTLLGTRGHAVHDFHYTVVDDDQHALATVTVGGSADCERLARQLERLVNVLWCRPLDAVARPTQRSDRSLVVDRYNLTVRGGHAGRSRHEAVVVARHRGLRQLGAGEGGDGLSALVNAFVALPAVRGFGLGRDHLDVRAEPLNHGEHAGALAWARLDGPADRSQDFVRFGPSRTGAAVHALTAACSSAATWDAGRTRLQGSRPSARGEHSAVGSRG